jgi:dihydrofolate reductase
VAFKLRAMNEMHGREGGEGDENRATRMAGGTSFHFVTEGIEVAIAEAKEAADDQDVSVGGASTIQQTIAAGLLDEIVVTQVPILLGGGTRLFDHLAPGAAAFELADVARGREALPLTYRLR